MKTFKPFFCYFQYIQGVQLEGFESSQGSCITYTITVDEVCNLLVLTKIIGHRTNEKRAHSGRSFRKIFQRRTDPISFSFSRSLSAFFSYYIPDFFSLYFYFVPVPVRFGRRSFVIFSGSQPPHTISRRKDLQRESKILTRQLKD